MAQTVIESSQQSWCTCTQPETPDRTTLVESDAEREARTVAGCARLAEHLRQEGCRSRGLEARARALDDATQEYAPVDAAHPIDTTQPEPDALAHATSPDAAPVDGEPEPEALAEKMINAAGQWITLNSKTTKKTSIEETTTIVMIRGQKRKTITETTTRIEIEGDGNCALTNVEK